MTQTSQATRPAVIPAVETSPEFLISLLRVCQEVAISHPCFPSDRYEKLSRSLDLAIRGQEQLLAECQGPGCAACTERSQTGDPAHTLGSFDDHPKPGKVAGRPT